MPTVRRAAIAAGLGTGASALFPEDAEAFPSVKNFAEKYGAAVRSKKSGHMLAGSLDNEEAFVEWAMHNNEVLLTYKTPTVNKTEIKKAIASGVSLDGVHIENRQNIQIK